MPRIQSLQEMVAEAACYTGYNGSGNCSTGYTATVACMDGFRDNQCVSQSWNCTNGAIPTGCMAGSSVSAKYCCKSGTTATTSYVGCQAGTYPSTTCQTGITKTKLCNSGTSIV